MATLLTLRESDQRDRGRERQPENACQRARNHTANGTKIDDHLASWGYFLPEFFCHDSLGFDEAESLGTHLESPVVENFRHRGGRD